MEYCRFSYCSTNTGFFDAVDIQSKDSGILYHIYHCRNHRCFGWTSGPEIGLASSFGAKLDSVSDLLFYGTMLIRFFPILHQELPRVIWLAVAGILLIRLASYAITALKNHCMASLHTIFNKITGTGVFLLPYLLETPFIVGYGWLVCGLAFVASVQELLIHIFYKNSKNER